LQRGEIRGSGRGTPAKTAQIHLAGQKTANFIQRAQKTPFYTPNDTQRSM
jgi:hypothetical protein